MLKHIQRARYEEESENRYYNGGGIGKKLDDYKGLNRYDSGTGTAAAASNGYRLTKDLQLVTTTSNRNRMVLRETTAVEPNSPEERDEDPNASEAGIFDLEL